MQLIQKFFLSLFLLLFTLPALGQNQCANAIFSDDFSNPSLWTYLGSHTNGVLDISGGTLNFKSYENRQNYRLVRNLALPLFNQWRIEWEFMETGNEERIGAMLMAVTSGSDHPRWATAGSPPETNQDMIGVFVDNPLTGGANPHRFFVSSKQGTNHQYGPSTIDYSVGVQYYMRLQRIAQDKAILSVYSDPARTNHIPGSPLCFDIDKNIGEFFFLQTGVSTLACACRYITATQDNLCIFGNNTPEGCLSEGCQINAAITRYVNSVDCSVTFTDLTTFGPGTTPLAGFPIDFGDGSSGTIPPGGSITHSYGTNSYTACMHVYAFGPNFECCSDQVCIQIFDCPVKDRVIGPQSSDPTPQSGVQLSPNPSENRIQIQSEKAIHGLRIYDINGKSIRQARISKQKVLEIDIEALPNGVYFLEIDLGDEITTKKFSKM